MGIMSWIEGRLAPAKAPEQISGHEKSYYYEAVEIWVDWRYGGRYGKDCKDLGIRKGDRLHLVPEPTRDIPKSVSVYWKNTKVGVMKENRLQDMVHQWLDADLPIYCAAAAVGGNEKLQLELCFYGKPGKNK